MPRSSRSLLVALLFVLVALTFSSCGGSAPSPTASTSATPSQSPLLLASPPTTLPPQGVRLGPADILLMPSTVDPTTLKVSSAAAAIAAAPQNDIPKTARALFASVTELSGGPLKHRLAWVVTYDWQKSQEIGWIATPMGQQQSVAHYAHGQVSIIDARSGKFLLGYCLMDP